MISATITRIAVREGVAFTPPSMEFSIGTTAVGLAAASQPQSDRGALCHRWQEDGTGGRDLVDGLFGKSTEGPRNARSGHRGARRECPSRHSVGMASTRDGGERTQSQLRGRIVVTRRLTGVPPSSGTWLRSGPSAKA